MTETDTSSKDAPKQATMDPAKEMSLTLDALKILEKLTQGGRQRALPYLADILGVDGVTSGDRAGQQGGFGRVNPGNQQGKAGNNKKYSAFAELLDAAKPDTGVQRALVGGYWLQVCGETEEFGSAEVNKELANAVGALSNITMAFDALKAANPALVIQTRKSGKAKQARKLYKLTVAGIRAVEDMIKAGASGGS